MSSTAAVAAFRTPSEPRSRIRLAAVGLASVLAVGCGGGPSGWPGFVDPPDGFTVSATQEGQACGPWALSPTSEVSDPIGSLKAWVRDTAGLERVDELGPGDVGFLGGFDPDEVGGGERVPMYVTANNGRYVVSFCSG